MGAKASSIKNTYIILGMHRSATSFIAKALKDQGVNIGERLLGPSKGNFQGHFENVRFLELNRKILKKAGGNWDNPPSEEAIIKAGNELQGEIKRLVEQERGGLWGWKDPRTTLTIRLYMPYLENPYFIVCFRNPYEVAKSLQKRNGFSLEKGLALAITYNERLLSFLTDFYLNGGFNGY
jgi:hypothetical protein